MIEQLYMSLPNDLGGSIAKSRFRNELMWGLWKIFDIYDTCDDFTIIFDYVCDIEIHCMNELSFYQIKTRKSARPYTCTQLTGHKDGTNSILGKVYLLKCAGTNELPIKVAIVSNVTFKATKKEYTEVKSVDFSLLDINTQESICKKLKTELSGEKQIDLKNVYFIRSQIDLFEPKNSVIGKMVSFFKESRGIELIKPHALYMSLFDTVEDKACSEFDCMNYDEVIQQKGITKKAFDFIISTHIEESNISVEKARMWIETHYEDDYPLKLKMISSLSSIVTGQLRDPELRKKKNEISSYVKNNLDLLPSSEIGIIDYLINRFEDAFVVGYDKLCLNALIILVLKELEEKGNE